MEIKITLTDEQINAIIEQHSDAESINQFRKLEAKPFNVGSHDDPDELEEVPAKKKGPMDF